MEQELSRQLNQFKLTIIALFVLCFSAIGYIGWKFSPTVVSITQQKEQSAPTAVEQSARIIDDLPLMVTGKVVSINKNSVTITTEIVDESKLHTLDYSKVNRLPTIEKSLSVNTSRDTVMPVTPKVGDMIMITTNESVYRSNTLTAASIEVAKPIDSRENVNQ